VKPPVVLLQGDSLFILDKAAQASKKCGDPAQISFETVTIADSDFGVVLSKARNKPFFCELQVFSVCDAQSFASSDLDLLESYLKNPPDYSLLILQWNEDGKDPYAKVNAAAKRLAEIVKKASGVVEIAGAQGSLSAVQSFIRAKVKNAGKEISTQALRGLEQMGQDFPALLDTAIENLILASGTSKEITEEMVSAFDEQRVRGNRFKFLDAVLARNTSQALSLFARLLDSGEDDPMLLLAFIHSQFKLYWLAQVWSARGYADSRVFSEIKLNPKRASFFTRQMRVFSKDQLENALEYLFEIDRAVKVGEEEIRTGLEKWIARVTGFKSAARAMSFSR